MNESSAKQIIDILKNPGEYSIETVCLALNEILNKTTLTKKQKICYSAVEEG